MSDRDDFLATVIARQVEAEAAIHKGDSAPRMEMWSRKHPVTLFGAWGPCKSGWDEVVHRHGDFMPLDQPPPRPRRPVIDSPEHRGL